jgi:hypothetical protein
MKIKEVLSKIPDRVYNINQSKYVRIAKNPGAFADLWLFQT